MPVGKCLPLISFSGGESTGMGKSLQSSAPSVRFIKILV